MMPNNKNSLQLVHSNYLLNPDDLIIIQVDHKMHQYVELREYHVHDYCFTLTDNYFWVKIAGFFI